MTEERKKEGRKRRKNGGGEGGREGREEGWMDKQLPQTVTKSFQL